MPDCQNFRGSAPYLSSDARQLQSPRARRTRPPARAFRSTRDVVRRVRDDAPRDGAPRGRPPRRGRRTRLSLGRRQLALDLSSRPVSSATRSLVASVPPRASGDRGCRRRGDRPAAPDVDGVVPAFGPGSPPWPSIHADLRAGKFGEVRTVTPAQAAAMLRDDARAGLADVRPRIEFEEFRCGGEETSGASALNARNVPYWPHRSAAKRWQGYFLCTKDGLKERDPAGHGRSARRSRTRPRPSSWGARPGGTSRRRP